MNLKYINIFIYKNLNYKINNILDIYYLNLVKSFTYLLQWISIKLKHLYNLIKIEKELNKKFYLRVNTIFNKNLLMKYFEFWFDLPKALVEIANCSNQNKDEETKDSNTLYETCQVNYFIYILGF